MRALKNGILAALLSGVVATTVLFAADAKTDGSKTKAKPYVLKTCPVSDEKLGGDMGDPYVFVQDGREVKLCCKSCLKDFKKDPAKYVKKIEEAEKKQKS